MSISWGKKQRYKFNSGVPLTSWTPPAAPGVYALTYKQDPETKPKSHTVLYFGHAEDLLPASLRLSQTCFRCLGRKWRPCGRAICLRLPYERRHTLAEIERAGTARI